MVAYQHDDAASAQRTLELAYTASVCKFGGDPFPLEDNSFHAVAAYRATDTAQIFWVVGDVLVVVNWSMYQSVDEGLRRATSAAGAVDAQIRQVG